MRKLLLILFTFLSLGGVCQPRNYPCQYADAGILSSLVGTWKVVTKDRISPGNYETNAGISVISKGIQGCSIKESYQGIFKEKNYAVEATLLMTDSMKIQRVYFDSEHANAMVFDGGINAEGMELFWVRDKKRKKMQVKFEMIAPGTDSFEWKTYLTTDFGETWQLTHHWQYTRVAPFEANNIEHRLIKSALDNYHDGLTTGNTERVKEALAEQFIMYNGNYSGDAVNWQAHMFLAGDDLELWPEMFIKEAGPYQNDFGIISIHIRGKAAVVATSDTGKNKFRQWNKEQTTWLLGKKENRWEILGYYLRDISNP